MLKSSEYRLRQLPIGHNKCLGQALVEYTLTGALICVASLGALMSLEDALDFVFRQLLSDMSPGASSSAPGSPSNVVNLPGSSPATPSPTPDNTSVSEGYTGNLANLTLPNGQVIEVSPTSTTTTGANGSTIMMASYLQQVAKEALEKGEITPEEATQLIELANQGHRLAYIESVVAAAAAAANGDLAAFQNMTVTFEGATYPASWLAGEIGLDANYNPNGYEIQAFYDLLSKANAISNPEIQNVVNSVSQQIITIADAVESAAWEVSTTDGSHDSTHQTNQLAALAGDGSYSTDIYSGVICTAGEGADSGISCTIP